jgi:hypothetical protein
MKKFLVLFIVLFTTIPAFAQDDDDQAAEWKGKRLAVTINPTTIVLGIMNEGLGLSGGVEYAFLKYVTAKLQLYVVVFKPDGIYNDAWSNDDEPLGVSFRLALDARWYPFGGAVEGLFANVGFQYQQTLGNFYLNDNTKFKGNKALGVFLGAGYKFVLGRGRVSFVIEPCLDVIWSFHLGKRPEYRGNWMLGQNGVRVGTHFGLAF